MLDILLELRRVTPVSFLTDDKLCNDVILVKLGGSVITNKSKPLSPRRAAIARIARALRRISEPVIVVHGGGSFGHYWSVKYGMHTRAAEYDMRGVAVVKNSMVALDKIVIDAFLEQRLRPYPLPPEVIATCSRVNMRRVREVAKIADAGMIPVTFGDAVWAGARKTFILSGDRIMSMIASVLRPRLCIFALGEDGVYDMPSRRVIPELDAGSRPWTQSVEMDVTGGMARKLVESARIARAGTDVFIVNGNAPDRIVDAVKRRRHHGTVIRGLKNGRRRAARAS